MREKIHSINAVKIYNVANNSCKLVQGDEERIAKGSSCTFGHAFSFPEILILLSNKHLRTNPDKLNNFRT